MFDKLQQVKVITLRPKIYRIANRGVHSEFPNETYDGQFPHGACGGGTRPFAHGHGWYLWPICHSQDGGPAVGDRCEEVHSEPSVERVFHFRDQPRDHASLDWGDGSWHIWGARLGGSVPALHDGGLNLGPAKAWYVAELERQKDRKRGTRPPSHYDSVRVLKGQVLRRLPCEMGWDPQTWCRIERASGKLY